MIIRTTFFCSSLRNGENLILVPDILPCVHQSIGAAVGIEWDLIPRRDYFVISCELFMKGN